MYKCDDAIDVLMVAVTAFLLLKLSVLSQIVPFIFSDLKMIFPPASTYNKNYNVVASFCPFHMTF